jgi:hypothetical protein
LGEKSFSASGWAKKKDVALGDLYRVIAVTIARLNALVMVIDSD